MKPIILMALEGTYPFHGGGVSTWVHIICNKVEKFDFKLYSVNAVYETKTKYTLSSSIKEILQVPMWFELEPREFLRFNDSYYDFVQKKENSFLHDSKESFLKLFKKFLDYIYDTRIDIIELENIIVAMWEFFQVNDYKSTMKLPAVWELFKQEIKSKIPSDQIHEITLLDITYAMRWVYHFLIPISVDFPKSEVIHLGLSSFVILPAMIQKRIHKTPILLTEHGVYIRERILAISQSNSSYFLKDFLIKLSECAARLTYHNADIIMSVNKFNFKWELMYGANPDKLRVVYNGIDHFRFKPLDKPTEIKDIPIVVAMARIFELKDILTMIRSCKVVTKIFPDVQFRVYGENDAVPKYTEKCLKLIEELGLQKNFLLLGPNSKPEEAFCEGDISVLTSISEGFPYTIIESMSCGIPVVATDVGGVSEALGENCGILCKPKDHESIGQAIIKLLQDKDLLKKMKIECRKRVEDYFTIDKFIEQYENLYTELINKSQQEKKSLL